MNTKVCFKCKCEKSIDDFYKHPGMTDGHVNKCKECNKKDVHIHRKNNLEAIRKYDIERSKLPDRKKSSSISNKKRKQLHPERKSAVHKVNYAISTGALVRQPCFICGDKAQGHHPDYSRPLDVVWLCPTHHYEAHAIARTFIYQQY